MKARLWQSLFLLNALITTEMILAEDTKKDVRDLKEQNIMSVLFQQTAAERLAGSLQTFRSAKQALDNALADPSWSALPGQDIQGKKPAIIVDVDETVLDNTAYEARMILDGTKYPEGWVGWGKEAAATEVPGAKDFLNYAACKRRNNFLCYQSSGGVKRSNQRESHQAWHSLGSNQGNCFNARRK